MRGATFIAAAALTTLSGAAAQAAPPEAAPPATTRTDLQRHDLSIPGREMIQTLVGFPPGAVGPPHKHPGEEIIYVTEGSIEYQVEGKPPVTLKAGDVLYIPYGAVHSGKNVGRGHAAELATYVVEKGKPLLVWVK